MARGMTSTQYRGRAALGFDDDAEFDVWVRDVVSAGSAEFPSFVMPNAGAQGESGDEPFVRPSTSVASGLVLAAMLLQGDRKAAEPMLGLHTEILDPWGYSTQGIRPERLSADRKLKLADSALTLLAQACRVVALAPLAPEVGRVAAGTLPHLGVPQAQRIARFLVRSRPEWEGDALRPFRNDASKRAKAKAADPTRAIAHVRDQLDRLLKALGKSAR